MLTQERLKEVLHYAPETGVWTWRQFRLCVHAGQQAGCLAPNGYRTIGVDNRLYQSSRLAFLYMEGYLPEHDMDHINRIKDDDRWANIRHVSRACNIKNSGLRSDNTSTIKGVYWHKAAQKWHACIAMNKKNYNLGVHTSMLEAAAHRFAAEQCLGRANCESVSTAEIYVKARADVSF